MSESKTTKYGEEKVGANRSPDASGERLPSPPQTTLDNKTPEMPSDYA